ncbi:TolC family protein [Candidatus Berkiella aquae]|uniref:TolC family protein n=1 Tax=Candidatus Berkiella aquae TaxID=295108 RepID=A0AAE3I067_9GAMM|nr:TolC family protein [Candidatus Berkiella aquae]MCS5712805.1 TolC family protein [Candidatus Berkiella aquae]
MYFIYIILSLSCSSLFADERLNYNNNVQCTQSDTSSLPLKIFIYQFLESHPSIQAAKANVAAANARFHAAEQPLYNPELIAETEQKRQKSFKDPELALEGEKPYEKTYTAGLNQTVDWVSKRSARSKVADRNFHIAESQLESLQQQLATEVINALIRYQSTRQVVKLSKERTSLLQKFVTLTEKREATGDVARVETDLAQLALSEALAQQADAEMTFNQALQILRSMTGLTNSEWPDLPNYLPSPSQMNTDFNELLNCLPAVQVLNEQILSAQMRIKLAQRERFPDPTFGLQGGQENTDEGTKRVIMATFSIPLFIRNSYKAEVEAANFDTLEVEEKRIDMIRQISADMMGSSERYQRLYQIVEEWQKIANKPLGDGITLIERLWQAGEMTTTDYLVQFKQRLDSQIAGAELRGRAWQAWAEWLKASGTVENWLKNN